MSKERECRDALRGIVGQPAYDTFACTVAEVNGITCDVLRSFDDKEIKDVRLNSTIKENDGLVIVPEIGSDVLVTNIDDDKYFISQFSKIEKVTLDVSGNIEINKGTFGGLVKIEELVEKINRIEDNLKNHQHSYIPYPGGTAGNPVSTTPNIPPLSFDNTKVSDLENKKVMH